MNESWRTGVSFGLTSATITTLGLMMGLHSGTHSRLVVLGGILTIAVADAFSDALGIHVAEEAEDIHTERQIWTSTLVTLLAKFLFALTFAVPVVLLPLGTAMVVNVVWGLAMLTVLSCVIARSQRQSQWKVAGEHLLIVGVVLVATHYLGHWIALLKV
jgi:VIT1/CCC1 family predicted Fe2+/Mn2+ transporter